MNYLCKLRFLASELHYGTFKETVQNSIDGTDELFEVLFFRPIFSSSQTEIDIIISIEYV